jgi:photosynthetic reaction center cytochrome c subunit
MSALTIKRTRVGSWLGLAALATTVLLAGCERPPVQVVQTGYRGTAMEQVYNPRTVAKLVEQNVAPEASPPAATEGPRAKDVFQNVKVLGDLSVGEFTRLMTSITNWVSPQEGCAYCHNLQNLAEESKYTKVVARRMIEMTQHINADWQKHVGATGVTCYTCHRGQNVPSRVWFAPSVERTTHNFIGDLAEQNQPARSVGLTSLPYDPFSAYLLDKDNSAPIRVNGTTALPTGNRSSIKQAEFTYGLMMHMSDSLGVNCTYCHNTQNFGKWDGSPPQRLTAYHGIRMARDLNTDYIVPLTAQFPPERLGPTGDVAKVYCATCHQGVFKPLYGAQMVKAYPELTKVMKTTVLPAPVSEPLFALMYFAVGSPVLEGVQERAMGQLIQTMKARPRATATISGFHSASGGAALNAELAKQRAFTVRDSLIAAGIAEGRITLEKPVETQANVAGEDASARRVEVRVN